MIPEKARAKVVSLQEAAMMMAEAWATGQAAVAQAYARVAGNRWEELTGRRLKDPGSRLMPHFTECPFPCMYCGQKFISQWMLDTHECA